MDELVVEMAQLGQTISMYQNLNTQNTNINEVAFSGSYTDLSNIPVIGAVGHNGQYRVVLSIGKFFPISMFVVLAMTVSYVVDVSPDLPG